MFCFKSALFILYLEQTYVTVSSTKYCGHVNGGYPARCYKNGVSNCQNECDIFDWCIAYSYNGNALDCSLMTSTGSCSSSWLLGSGDIAQTLGQLVESSVGGYNCMFKTSKSC